MKILLFANTEWNLYNFRLPLAQTIKAQGHNVVCISPSGSYGARLQEAGGSRALTVSRCGGAA